MSGISQVFWLAAGASRLLLIETSRLKLEIGVVDTPAGNCAAPSWFDVVPFERCSELGLELELLVLRARLQRDRIGQHPIRPRTMPVLKVFSELCGRRRICDSVQVAGLVTSTLP